MDIENTVEFLLNTQAAHAAAIGGLTDDINRLTVLIDRITGVLSILADSHTKLIERLNDLVQRTEAVAQQPAQRDKALDDRIDRIDKLVSAIGMYLGNKPVNG